MYRRQTQRQDQFRPGRDRDIAAVLHEEDGWFLIYGTVDGHCDWSDAEFVINTTSRHPDWSQRQEVFRRAPFRLATPRVRSNSRIPREECDLKTVWALEDLPEELRGDILHRHSVTLWMPDWTDTNYTVEITRIEGDLPGVLEQLDREGAATAEHAKSEDGYETLRELATVSAEETQQNDEEDAAFEGVDNGGVHTSRDIEAENEMHPGGSSTVRSPEDNRVSVSVRSPKSNQPERKFEDFASPNLDSGADQILDLSLIPEADRVSDMVQARAVLQAALQAFGITSTAAPSSTTR